MVEIQFYLLYFEEELRGFHYSIICWHHNEVFAAKKEVNLKNKQNKILYNYRGSISQGQKSHL